MSVSMRRVSTLALVGLAALGMLALCSEAQAQIRPNTFNIQAFNGATRPNPNPLLAPGLRLNQAAYNTAVLGTAASFIPPYALGYNPYPQVVSTGPVYPSINPYTPYPLMTGASTVGNPYYAGATLSSGSGGGYGLSTYGNSYGSGGSGSGYYPGYGFDPGPVGGARWGAAQVVDSLGRYQKNIMQAALTREQVRQAAIETRRRWIQEEAEYERMRPRAIDLIRREKATDLAMARIGAPDVTVWSGKALNDLLESINKPGRRLNTGPKVELDEETIKNVNLSNAAFKGQVALLKTGGKLLWPSSLRDTRFDEVRDNFSSKFKFAVGELKSRDPVDPAAIKDLRGYLKTFNELLASGAEDLSPSQYIEARKYLNQLTQAVRALDDPKVGNYFDGRWVARGRTVAELVQYMTKEGLQFAPATPGEEAPYNALYQSLRVFEAALPGGGGVASGPREPREPAPKD